MIEPTRRRFSAKERVALFVAAGGECIECGTPLDPGWHADHRKAYSLGGETDLLNGDARCPHCNLTKGARPLMDDDNTRSGPRRWQHQAFDRWLAHDLPDFLVVATPGAGKTRFALRCVRHGLDTREERVIVVAPTSHLKEQWKDSAKEHANLELCTDWDGASRLREGFDGIVITYQHAVTLAAVLRQMVGKYNTIVVFDEIHHAGDEARWGQSIRWAFEAASRRLLLSGTPFRTDGTPIPFVTYENRESKPDFHYTYGEAQEDRVCRPLFFPRYGGTMEWHDGMDTVTASFEEMLDPKGQSQRLRTALAPDSDHIRTMLTDADAQLRELRTDGDPPAGGLVLAMDVDHAKELAKVLRVVSGSDPTVVTSEDLDASDKIKRYAASTDPWIVAVRMVSEGVDIPRLRVLVYATNTATAMFFRQAVGRVVRWQDKALLDEPAFAFIPDDLRLRALAQEIIDERGVALRDELDRLERDRERENRQENLLQGLFVPISGSGELAGVTHDGDLVGSSEYAEAERVGKLVGFKSVDEFTKLARALRVKGAATARQIIDDVKAEPPLQDRLDRLRTVNERLAKRLAYASGMHFSHVNSAANKAIGVRGVAEASEEQLEKRSDWLKQRILEEGSSV